MKTNAACGLAITVATVGACYPTHRVMQPMVLKTSWDVTKSNVGNDKDIPNEYIFPKVFLDYPEDPLNSAAINCMQAYNGSVGENHACTSYSDWLARGEIVSIATVGVVTGIAATINSDQARKHYTAVGLTAAAVATAIIAYDKWINCNERANQEFNNAREKLRALEVAARLFQCAIKLEKMMKDSCNESSISESDAERASSIETEESKADFICGEPACGQYLPLRIFELRDRANKELQRCILIGRPTNYGPVPSVPRI